ncbi:metal ABC transporter solute-binding protein, Zn/Mn family [Amycolatopsis alkalitolerans]|uniref:Metal ABC transporter substrate-binding protein n=1 Tax=Amycolatopsis alkalitolerans TaxID=2547244 RepID=A0A5C4M4H3_9PSEU|nr:zinc ABC transporter substrate-binding protein [Amycolatopsis alkalitolerans]TNC27998.1 metal ABC transporter substrate-binding protein [Amycolatopsis alkalitolerans]
MRQSRLPRLIGLVSAASALALALAGCGGGNSTGTTDGKLDVVASTDVWGSVLAAVGGDQVQVTSIIHDPAADPHSYETTPQDALAAQKAVLTLGNGGGYDDFFTKLADQATNAKKLVAYDIAATGDDNEHVWYSFASVDKIADRIAADLGQLRPADAKTFTANADAFKAKVASLQTKTEQAGAAHPGEKVIATEPVAHYLLETAKVTDVTPRAFSDAVEQENDVPAAALAEVNSLIDGKQVKAIVNNAQTVTPVTQQVVDNAKRAGLPVVNVTETLPAGATGYISWMTGQVDALAGALNS